MRRIKITYWSNWPIDAFGFRRFSGNKVLTTKSFLATDIEDAIRTFARWHDISLIHNIET